MTLCMWPHVYLTPTLSKSIGDKDPHARSLTYTYITLYEHAVKERERKVTHSVCIYAHDRHQKVSLNVKK